jgi:NAD(P)-dependent dehydrogenase (short-subunit alcohol dehydrogenase family)|tara:strand:+ start:6119 stop:6838 length:720 start_codon:yes stop_codon:yes gene_type:complete
MQTLENQNVVVIGGTSGIGLATAIAATEHGANVWAASRSEETIAKAKNTAPDSIRFSALDTHDVNGLRELFAEIGTIHHLVSAATGANRTMAPFMEQTAEQFSEAFNKFWGYTNVVRAGVPHLSEDGSVVLVSGVPARKCNPGMSAISCVGNAVEGLGRALALELAPKRVNVVAPGIIDTAMFDRMGDGKAAAFAQMSQNIPLKRVGQANEVANAILFLMTTPFVTGTTIDVDGGQLLP